MYRSESYPPTFVGSCTKRYSIMASLNSSPFSARASVMRFFLLRDVTTTTAYIHTYIHTYVHTYICTITPSSLPPPLRNLSAYLPTYLPTYLEPSLATTILCLLLRRKELIEVRIGRGVIDDNMSHLLWIGR